MSEESIKYSLSSVLGDYSDLEFCLDSEHSVVDATGGGSFWTGYFPNLSPADDEYRNIALILNGTGSSKVDAIANSNNLIDNNGLSLMDTNLKIPLRDLDLSESSFILDFQMEGEVSSGVLFGAFEKEALLLPDSSYITGSKGYNFGITDRGHLFVQGFSLNSGFVEVFTDIELSERNVFCFNHSSNLLEVGFFDYFDNNVKSFTKKLDSFYCQSPENIYIGGTSELIEKTTPNETTFDGYLKSISIFNKKINTNSLYEINTGFLSDYYFNDGGQVFIEEKYLSGEVVTYKTGITGYDCSILTGSETLGVVGLTGEPYITGEITVQEGSLYTFLKNGSLEQGRYISNLHSGEYNTTGEGAFDTLGLESYSANVSGYSFDSGYTFNSGDYNYYECTPLTGFLDEVSGVDLIYGTTGHYIDLPDSSGINFELDSEKFKMEYIYYVGDRS